MRFYYLSLQKSTIRLISTSSKAVISRSSTSQNRLEQYVNGSESSSIKSLNKPSILGENSEDNVVQQYLNTNPNNTSPQEIIVKPKGIKRKLDESSSDILDNGPSNKKLLMSNDSEQSVSDSSTSNINATQNWVNNTTQTEQLAPEQPIIPISYKEEAVGICENNKHWADYVRNTFQESKSEAYRLIDELASNIELLKVYANDILIRIRERKPTEFSRDIDYDSTFDSDSENGNELPDLGRENLTGMMEPRLSSISQEDSNSEDEGLESSSEESDHIEVGDSESGDSESYHSNYSEEYQAALDAFDANQMAALRLEDSNTNVTVPNLDNPELGDNPEMTVHHSSSSNDAIASVNVSTDSGVADPYLGAGLAPLNNGQGALEVTYSEMAREDQHIHSNYLINTRGTDNMDYRIAFDYLIDSLRSLDLLIQHSNVVAEVEAVLHRMEPSFADYTSRDIFDAANAILLTLSGVN